MSRELRHSPFVHETIELLCKQFNFAVSCLSSLFTSLITDVNKLLDCWLVLPVSCHRPGYRLRRRQTATATAAAARPTSFAPRRCRLHQKLTVYITNPLERMPCVLHNIMGYRIRMNSDFVSSINNLYHIYNSKELTMNIYECAMFICLFKHDIRRNCTLSFSKLAINLLKSLFFKETSLKLF